MRLVTSRFLSRAGVDVTEVVDGSEVLRVVRQAEQEGKPIGLILMEMQMPNVDGREATQRLRDEGYSMLVIALTAGATADEVQDALAAGYTEFVAKPVDAPNLIR
ncbi:response regulator [Planctomycetaceae bacterium SH139]